MVDASQQIKLMTYNNWLYIIVYHKLANTVMKISFLIDKGTFPTIPRSMSCFPSQPNSMDIRYSRVERNSLRIFAIIISNRSCCLSGIAPGNPAQICDLLALIVARNEAINHDLCMVEFRESPWGRWMFKRVNLYKVIFMLLRSKEFALLRSLGY